MIDLLKTVPDARIISGADDLEPYRRDESHVVGALPLAAVRPRGPAALRELVRLAKAEGFSLVPRGAGTGKAGGCTPLGRCVVVDMGEYPGAIRVSRPDLCLWAPRIRIPGTSAPSAEPWRPTPAAPRPASTA